MFDFAWSEIALIGVVALVAIGPKDMPVAIRAVAKAMKKAKGMAAEFQTHVDEMVREADLHEVRDQINSIRRMDLRGHLERTVDPDGSIRNTLRDDPFKTKPATSAELPTHQVDATQPAPAVEAALPMPAAEAAPPDSAADARPAYAGEVPAAGPTQPSPSETAAQPGQAAEPIRTLEPQPAHAAPEPMPTSSPPPHPGAA